MRIVIFVISCFFLLLVFFGLYMNIGMRGDYSYAEVLVGSLPYLALAFIFVILAFKFMKQKKGAVSIKKWPRIVLIIFLSLNLLYWSIIVFLGNALGRIFPLLSSTPDDLIRLTPRNVLMQETIFFIVAFIVSLIILLPPLVYLIKPRKEIKPER